MLIINFIEYLIIFSIIYTQQIKTQVKLQDNTLFNKIDRTTLDLTNIPVEILNFSTIEDVLDILASKKYRSCQAILLHNPVSNKYYFRGPGIKENNKNPLSEYLPVTCRQFKSRKSSLRQRFLFTYSDIEQIMNNNEDSILSDAALEVTQIKDGFEISLFPVKFFKLGPEDNYLDPKEHLCYDSVKIIGLDANNNFYIVASASDEHNIMQHSILHCKGQDFSKFIRYSNYCDEFCNEDFMYFSSELVRCKCDFFSYVKKLKKKDFSEIKGKKKKKKSENAMKNGTLNDLNDFEEKENELNECMYSNKIDRYEIFANSYDLSKKALKNESKNKPYLKFYFHILIIIFTIQIFYTFYFQNNNDMFIKITVVSFTVLTITFYIAEKINDLYKIEIIFEVISDIYPICILIFQVIEMLISNANVENNTILKKNSNGNSNGNGLLNGKVVNMSYEIMKISFLIILCSFDHILKETKSNLIGIIFRILLFGFLQFINWGDHSHFLLTNLKFKLIFEFFSRALIFFIDSSLFSNTAVPLFIILGRPRDTLPTHDLILFQNNYLRLKPYFEVLYENWFLEALNSHKLKNMLAFLQIVRYILLLGLLTLINSYTEYNRLIDNIASLKLDNIGLFYINVSYKNCYKIFLTIYKNFYIRVIHLPILFSLIYANIFVTRESMVLFMTHTFIGWITCYILNLDDESERFNRGSLVKPINRDSHISHNTHNTNNTNNTNQSSHHNSMNEEVFQLNLHDNENNGDGDNNGNPLNEINNSF